MFLNRTFGDFLHKGKNVSCFLPRGKAQGAPSPALPRVRSRKPTASPLVALDLEHPGLLQRQGKRHTFSIEWRNDGIGISEKGHIWPLGQM